jgi:hypothetical protein
MENIASKILTTIIFYDILLISAMKKRSTRNSLYRERAVGESPRDEPWEVTLERCKGKGSELLPP